MYSLSDFGGMIADEIRTSAYARALRAVVNQDSVERRLAQRQEHFGIDRSALSQEQRSIVL